MSDEFSTTRLYVGNLEAPSQDSTGAGGHDDTEPGIHLFISILTHFISIAYTVKTALVLIRIILLYKEVIIPSGIKVI